jgi:hypothetical protein
MAEEAPGPAELEANLKEYEEQLEQVGCREGYGTGMGRCWLEKRCSHRPAFRGARRWALSCWTTLTMGSTGASTTTLQRWVG